MPNLVHSLDATTLILLFHSFYLEKRKIEKTLNFYSVHDCFDVTANDVDTLIRLIRNVYINIYSEKRYL